jgi:hypothetical protein
MCYLLTAPLPFLNLQQLSAIGGRPSTLNASSIMGKEGDSFAMDEGATRFSQGSR